MAPLWGTGCPLVYLFVSSACEMTNSFLLIARTVFCDAVEVLLGSNLFHSDILLISPTRLCQGKS